MASRPVTRPAVVGPTTPPLLLLLLLLCAASQARAALNASHHRPTQSSVPHAYVSLLYNDEYVLPVRVMMRSLLINSPDVASGERERVVITTGKTSLAASRQLMHDGVRVIHVPSMRSPYRGDPKFQARFSAVMTKLHIFNMTQYERLVFIDADALVLSDLSPLFSCGRFCASFINPCHFNTGLMHIIPNATVFADMLAQLPHLPSYDGGDQGFLNSYFPKMLDAAIFDPKPSQQHPSTAPLTRLPFSWHADHSAYFPTFDFAFAGSTRCGEPRLIEWLGPPVAKPWVWWNYSVLDLSWLWHTYRRQLHESYPPNSRPRGVAFVVIATAYLLVALLVAAFRRDAPSSPFFLRALPRLCPFKRAPLRMAAFFPVLAGVFLWLLALVFSVVAVPEILPPYFATAVFLHARIALTLLALVCIGCVFCIGQRGRLRGTGVPVTNSSLLQSAFRYTFAWAVFESLYLVVWTAFSWRLSFSNMWQKAALVASVILSEFALLLVMLARVTLMWLAVAESFDGVSAI